MHVRSLFAVALAALLVGPATVHAQAKKTSAKAAPAKAAVAPAQATTTTPNFSIGGWIGYETDDPFGGVQFRGDFVWPFEKLAPGLDLSFVGSVGLSRLSHSESFFGETLDATAWEFKLVPTARFTYTFNPQWSVFGDAGLGLNYTSVSVDTNVFGFGKQTVSDSSTGLMIRLGAGGFFAVAPRVKLGAMIVVDPSTGSNNLDTWSFLAGANFQL